MVVVLAVKYLYAVYALLKNNNNACNRKYECCRIELQVVIEYNMC